MRTRKLIALLLVVCMMSFALIGVQTTAFASTVLSENNIGLLTALRIIPANFNMDSQVTRAEFAVVAANTMGHGELLDGNNGAQRHIYLDVPPEHTAWSAISLLFETGVMTGYNAMFRPNDPIRFEEAIKVFLSITNYAQIAAERGGFPTGYIIVASQHGLLNGINFNVGSAMTGRDVAAMAANALKMRMLIFTGIGDGGANFINVEGRNLLTERFDVFSSAGVLTCHGVTSLISVQNILRDNQVMIDDEVFYIGATSPQQYLGQTVEYYYHWDSVRDTRTLLFITAATHRNEIITINARNIDASTTTNIVRFYNNGRQTTAALASNARFIYNGKLLSIVTDGDLVPRVGDITLIDSDNNGQFETVIINSFNTIIVDSVIAGDGIIRARYTGEVFVLDDPSYIVRIYQDGAPIEMSAIARGNVVSIQESKNISGDRLFTLRVFSETIDGMVSEIATISDTEIIIVLEDGTSYNISYDYIYRAALGLNGSRLPQVGRMYTLHFDVFGDIAAAYADLALGQTFGYLIGARVSPGFAQSLQLRIFSQTGILATYESRPRITVNGESGLTPEAVFAMLQDPGGSTGDVRQQLIIYETNADGEIMELNLAIDKTHDLDYEASEGEFIFNTRLPTIGRVYKNLFEDRRWAICTSSTLIFTIPLDTSREMDFNVRRGMTISDESIGQIGYLYNVGPGGVVGAMVMVGDGAGTRHGRPRIVERVTTVLTEEGEIANRIHFVGGISMTTLSEESIVFSNIPRWGSWGYDDVRLRDLVEGDIIQYLTRDGVIIDIRVLVRAEDPMGSEGLRIISERTYNEPNAGNANQFARVLSVSHCRRFVLIEYNRGAGNFERLVETRRMEGSVSRFDSRAGRIVPSSLADIQAGDYLFINAEWLSTRMMVIFRDI